MGQGQRRSEAQFLSLARAALLREVLAESGAQLLEEVRTQRLDPYSAAQQLVALLRPGHTDP